MAHKTLIAVAIIIAIASACKKHPVNLTPVEPPVKDTKTVRLKEVVEPGLSTPYFKFSYTDSGYVSDINFADGLFIYSLSYKHGRIDKMVNTRLNEVFTYYYSTGNVSYVTLHNNAGVKLRSYKLTYNNDRRLTEANYYVFPGSTTDSLNERRVLLQYDAKGNLVKNEDYRTSGNQPLALSTVTQYAQYDNGTNTDDVYLLKDFMSHLLYLPQVKFQKNNPGVVTIQNLSTDYRIDYTYSYDNNLPVTKSGRMEQTRGADAGKVFNFTNTYSYY